MATTGDGRALCGGADDRKRPVQTETNEEAHDVSQEAGRNNTTGVSDQGGHSATAGISLSELEQMLKQMTFTRSETQHLIAVLYSRTIEESPSNNVIGQAPTQDSELFINNATCLPKTPMASPQHPTTMDNLPSEILVNIFIRLLAKQVAQMRSVSKSWNALLSQSFFVKSHLDRSIHNNDPGLLVFYHDSEPFTVLPSRSPHLELTNSIKLPLNPQFGHDSFRVIGSVNGLICSSYDNYVIQIWNPSLSARLTLPPYSLPYPDNYDSIEIRFRFGFEPKTDDYRVVKLVGLTRPSTNVGQINKEWLQLEVYSMRKGSWRLITERFPLHITYISDDEEFCVDGHDGRLHWLGYIGKNWDLERIVAFDLGSETFREIPLPDSTLHSKMNPENGESTYLRFNSLGVLGGKLCVMSWVENVGFEVWVMNEYGVAESWVKRYVLPQIFGYVFSFGFTSHNEFLAFDDNDDLVLYDPNANKTKILGKCRHAPHRPLKILEYVDSLVWVAPAEFDMVDGARQI